MIRKLKKEFIFTAMIGVSIVLIALLGTLNAINIHTIYVDGQKCQCFKKATVDLLYTQSNLQEILQKENFDSFSFDYYSDTIRNEATGMTARETAKDAVFKAWQFIDTFNKRFQNLFLYGNTGVGKTFLSNCIAKELIDRANCVIYSNFAHRF